MNSEDTELQELDDHDAWRSLERFDTIVEEKPQKVVAEEVFSFEETVSPIDIPTSATLLDINATYKAETPTLPTADYHPRLLKFMGELSANCSNEDGSVNNHLLDLVQECMLQYKRDNQVVI